MVDKIKAKLLLWKSWIRQQLLPYKAKIVSWAYVAMRYRSWVVIGVILAILPVTVWIAMQVQETRQHASGPSAAPQICHATKGASCSKWGHYHDICGPHYTAVAGDFVDCTGDYCCVPQAEATPSHSIPPGSYFECARPNTSCWYKGDGHNVLVTPKKNGKYTTYTCDDAGITQDCACSNHRGLAQNPYNICSQKNLNTARCPYDSNPSHVFVIYHCNDNTYTCVDIGQVSGQCNVLLPGQLTPTKTQNCEQTGGICRTSTLNLCKINSNSGPGYCTQNGCPKGQLCWY